MKPIETRGFKHRVMQLDIVLMAEDAMRDSGAGSMGTYEEETAFGEII